MPVDFLTDEQALRYGCYSGEPTVPQLARYFYLDDSDRSSISIRRGDHNRLGFAVQLCTVRFLGIFLSDPTDVPAGVVKHLAVQLSIHVSGCLTQYLERPATHREHAGEIQRRGGYRDFTEQPGHLRLVRWLYTRSWLSAERPSVLFDLATARLVERKILLPGVTVLTRLIARVRDRAAARLWRLLARLPSGEQRERLERLLIVPEQDHLSPLDRLRRAPARISAPAMVDALERLNNIRSFGVSYIEMARLPAGRIKALARYAAAAWAANIERMPLDRRIATLVAFAHTFEAIAQDDALDLLNQLIIQNLARAERKGEKERLGTIHDLDAAAIRLKEVGQLVLNPECEDAGLRLAIYKRIGKEQVEQAVATIEALTRPADDNYYDFLLGNYTTIRRFLPSLLRTIHFEGVKAAQPTLKAIQFLKGIEGRSHPAMNGAPRDLLNRAWQKLVVQPDGKLDRRFYSFCMLENLQDGLGRRDIFVTPSERWSDPRAKLLQGAGWEALRPHVCRTLDLSATAEPELEALATQLDEAYVRVARNLPENPDVRIEHANGKGKLSLTGLDKLEEPGSLTLLRAQVDALLPRLDLTDAILEMATPALPMSLPTSAKTMREWRTWP